MTKKRWWWFPKRSLKTNTAPFSPAVESFWKGLIWLISNVKVTTLRSSHISIFSEYSPHKLKSDQNFLQILNISTSLWWRWRRWLLFLKRVRSLKGHILSLNALYNSERLYLIYIISYIICSTMMDLTSWLQALWRNWLSNNIADVKSFTFKDNS